MSEILIMPKQTGQKDAFYASLELYYDAYIRGEQWYSNNDFKIEIQKKLPYLSQGAQDGPYLVKQSELTRYFGLVYYDYGTKPGRGHITDTGVKFFEAYLKNNYDLQIEIIMEAIFYHSFGRNNTAIKTSNSDVDAPKLFLRAIVDLNGISRSGLAYLLYITHDLKINYTDAIIELSKMNDKDREIPIQISNKYSDVKFTVFLKSLGIVDEKNNLYVLSEYTKQHYIEKITSLSIYNQEPKVTLTLNDTIEENDIDQNKVITSYAYNLTSPKFLQQNNRQPISCQKGNIIRYKTNPRIAKTALERDNYKCLINATHETFISKLEKPYMEAHHLIPMASQKNFSVNIDRIENIVSICPICHSAIHLGNEVTRLELVKKLYDLKEAELKKVGLNISFEELFSKYYI